MKYVWWGVGLVVAGLVFEFFHEQLKTMPIQPDASGIVLSSATNDNSALATQEVTAYGAFQPQQPQIPDTPWGWSQFISQGNGGVVPPGAGVPKYAY